MPRRSKLSIKKIASYTDDDLSSLTKKDLQAAYRSLRQAVQRREKTFIKHGAENLIPKGVRELQAPSRLSKKDLRESIKRAGNFYLSKYGTYTGVKHAQKTAVKKIKARTGVTISTEDIYDFDRFMQDARERMGELFTPAYSELAELYDAAKDKNLMPDQLLKNYQYWLEQDHINALRESQPITREGTVYPSDYVKKLNLQPIKKYYRENE